MSRTKNSKTFFRSGNLQRTDEITEMVFENDTVYIYVGLRFEDRDTSPLLSRTFFLQTASHENKKMKKLESKQIDTYFMNGIPYERKTITLSNHFDLNTGQILEETFREKDERL